ncbi:MULTISPECIES: peptide deformylase [Olivibacter]|uniref:Peptide deformylase n=2 Tax=Olivibacter TaxID=376469 RepID=A0ABV6HEP6_9SPHI|nr:MULTISPECIES: peptide deformylase [Olivibacter]MDM8177408.1 peptide deformylase [Olivibacter sp. 47]MDX3912125.1 peptide deformylase [Pseudosphingobacterium sp.]QEK99852.1 peptide deformylase [Olivibacter sp. LS-1]
MILPILAYGATNLRKACLTVSPSYPDLNSFIKNLWQTLDNAAGVGLAAPQVNENIQLFVVDSRISFSSVNTEDMAQKDYPGIRQAFINPKIMAHSDEMELDEEGCLSIPGISFPVKRFSWIKMTYLDENFQLHTDYFYGRTARIIQHEYDHILGKLPIDYLSELQKLMINKKLNKIRNGRINPGYPMRY